MVDKYDLAALQGVLSAHGAYKGRVDGVTGPATRAAVGAARPLASTWASKLSIDLASLGPVAPAPSKREFPDIWYELVDRVVARAPAVGLNPQFVLAQLAIESGWGRNVPSIGGKSSYNFGGIKANSAKRADFVDTVTSEFLDGKWTRESARWAVYKDVDDFLDGYFWYLLDSPSSYRYRDKGLLQAKSAYEFFKILGDNGYATDPDYANKGAQVARSVERRRFA